MNQLLEGSLGRDDGRDHRSHLHPGSAVPPDGAMESGVGVRSFRRSVAIATDNLRVFECTRTPVRQMWHVCRIFVRLTQTLSNLPRPLEHLIAKLGEQPAEASSAQRKNLVHKVSSAKSERRPYKPNRKLSPEEVQNLVARYEAGMSIADLARQFGMHTQTVDCHLKRQGVQKRGTFKLSREQVAEGVDLYADGWSTIEIAGKQRRVRIPRRISEKCCASDFLGRYKTVSLADFLHEHRRHMRAL
ncbi:helix-turn-helix domain-containing protein [Nocardia arthritidis]|uniref:Helix-turn-helix domain-containing protein n=1 Tax=Nocardia arthritidis TaxID=228602 RepID=A0A6G9Y9L2_9NOCA|nr:helix-turn-helix domain-containing protein [Nocardia arthritidis]